jgi:hypothetical protein
MGYPMSRLGVGHSFFFFTVFFLLPMYCHRPVPPPYHGGAPVRPYRVCRGLLLPLTPLIAAMAMGPSSRLGPATFAAARTLTSSSCCPHHLGSLSPPSPF